MHTLEDLLQHFGDEFVATGNTLKKFLSAPNSVKTKILDANSKPIHMETIADLKVFLQTEVDAYQLCIDELEVEPAAFFRGRGEHTVNELEKMVMAQKEELITLKGRK